MDIQLLRIVPLLDRTALSDFHSGESEIDRNIEKCCDWHSRHRARVFCACIDGNPTAYGFYCLAISASTSPDVKKEMVRISDERAYVPFVYLNYIAVRAEHQNQKIGTLMLMNALSRCGQVVRNVGIYGIALHALTDRAARLYERYGFRQISEMKYPFMILPTQSLIDLTEGEPDRFVGS